MVEYLLLLFGLVAKCDLIGLLPLKSYFCRILVFIRHLVGIFWPNRNFCRVLKDLANSEQWTVSALQAQKMSQGLTFSIPLFHFLQYNFHSIENKLLYLFYSTFTIRIFSSILTHYFISDYSIQPLLPPVYLFYFCCFILIFLLLFSICFVFYFGKIFI